MQINVLHMTHLMIRYGVEKQLLDHLRLAKEAANEIRHHVCALKISESVHREIEELGVPYIINRLWPWNFNEFANFVKKNNIHILHIHNQLRFPLRSRILPKLAGVPLILEHEHGMVWNTSSTPLMKWTNGLVAASICNSNAARIMLKQKCGIDGKVIYNGVTAPPEQQGDNGQLKLQLGLPQDTPLVGFVGRLNNPKGAEAFIRMIPLVNRAAPPARFLVVGDGPMRGYLESNANKLGVKEQVYFLGYQPNAYQLMKLMDVIVVPSLREPFGNVVIEAAFARKPVVASNVDGIAETVVDGETGYLVDCTEPATRRLKGTNRLPAAVVDGRTRELRPPYLPNTEVLAEKVIACLEDPELAASLGNKAYLRAKNLFSLERYRADLDNLYRELVSSRNKRLS